MVFIEDKKCTRIAKFIIKLINGEYIRRNTYMEKFGINERTFRRDKKEVSQILNCKILSKLNDDDTSYYLIEKSKKMTYEDVLVILKILVSSRAFATEEMMNLKNIFISYLWETPDIIKKCIHNDVKDYTQLTHNNEDEKKAFLEISQKYIDCGNGESKKSKESKEYSKRIFDLENVIHRQKKLVITYQTAENKLISIKAIPLDVIFSEFYFYLILVTEEEPENYFFYRIDRIINYNIITTEDVSEDVYYYYENSEIKKYILFMQKGKKIDIKFKFWGKSVSAVMDRMPTAEVIGEEDGKKIIKATGYSRGLKMWLLTQGEFVEVLEPEDFREEMKMTVNNMANNYK